MKEFMLAGGMVAVLTGAEAVNAKDSEAQGPGDQATATPTQEFTRDVGRIIQGSSRAVERAGVRTVDEQQVPTGTPPATETLQPPYTPTPFPREVSEDAAEEPVEVAQVSTPTLRPEAGETLVAMVSGETLQSSLAGYPRSVEVHSIENFSVTTELNPATLRPIVGTDGRIVAPGYYTELPSNLANMISGNGLLRGEQTTINGTEASFGYIVGFVSAETAPYGGPVIHVSFPARLMSRNGTIIRENSQKVYGTVFYGVYGQGNQMFAIDRNSGQLIPPSGNGHYNFGTNPNTDVTLSNEGFATFPTVRGVENLEPGDPIVIEILRNPQDTGRSVNSENGNLTPDEVIETFMDNDPTNDARWYNMDVPPAVAQYIVWTMSDQ
jgi:hypothetical protein